MIPTDLSAIPQAGIAEELLFLFLATCLLAGCTPISGGGDGNNEALVKIALAEDPADPLFARAKTNRTALGSP